MHPRAISQLALTLLAGLLVACGSSAGPQPTQAAATSAPVDGNPQVTASGADPTPAVAPTDANTIQDDVPMLDNPIDLKITSGGTFISYKAESTVEVATAFYQEKLEAAGWERVNKKDSGFGDSITLLRNKPDQNISVTIQSIAGSSNVKIQITLSPK